MGRKLRVSSMNTSGIRSPVQESNKLPGHQRDKTKRKGMVVSSVVDVEVHVKRRKGLGVRVSNGRIYDSENGQTCHQCRQKTIEFMALCKSAIGKNKCRRNFCPKCLLNRYGEKVDQVVEKESWACPTCRGICNCSICMKKQGRTPTGILSHTAKATGFGSVAELLLKCSNNNQDVEPCPLLLKKESLGESISADNKANDHMLVGKGASESSEHFVCRIDNALLTLSKANKRELDLPEEADVDRHVGVRELDKESQVIHTSSQLTKSTARKKVKMQKPIILQAQVVGERTSESTKNYPESQDTSAMPNKLASFKSVHSEQTISVEVPVKPDLHWRSLGNGNSQHIENTQRKRKASRKLIVALNGDVEGIPYAGVNSNTANQDASVIDGELECNCTKESEKFHSSSEFEPEVLLSKRRKQKKESNIPLDAHPKIDATKNGAKGVEKHEGALLSKNKQPKNRLCSPSVSLQMEEILPSTGKQLVTVAGIELSPNAVGPALQLVEFCSAFKEILCLKKGEVDALIRECARGCSLRRGSQSLLVQMHVKLLSIIQESSGELGVISHSSSGKNSWLQVLSSHLNKRSCIFTSGKTSPSSVHDWSLSSLSLMSDNNWIAIKEAVQAGAESYGRLDICNKLQLLNSVCDDSLETELLRSHIEAAILEYQEIQKENREKLLVARNEAKKANQQKKDAEVARLLALSNSKSPISLDEENALLTKVQLEIERSTAAKSAANETALQMGRQRCDAVRTEPIALMNDGRAFYKLEGANERDAIVFQDISNTVSSISQDSWSVYSKEEDAVLAKYLSFQRTKKLRRRCNYPECLDFPDEDGIQQKLLPEAAKDATKSA